MRDPFVREVVRIIKKSNPRQWGEHTIVLVSYRFYHAALKDLEYLNSFFDPADLTRHDCRQLLITGILVLPVRWLSDYEFEIRPPMK